MLLRFWLLDINHAELEIRLWGVDDHGNRVLVLDRSFRPYFYVVPSAGVDSQQLAKRIPNELPDVLEAEVVERRYFGKPLQAIKVTCGDPAVVKRCAKQLSKAKGVSQVLEDDIRFPDQYLINYELIPCGWHEVEVKPVPNSLGAQVDAVYSAKSPPRPVERDSPPRLRTLSFFPVCYSKVGSPRPERDPVILLATQTSEGERKVFLADGLDDRSLFHSFIDYVRSYDPDVIVGYYSNRGAWPFLMARAKHLGIELSVDRIGSEPHMSLYGHVSITGRANVDWFDFAEDIPEVKVKTLENVADFLGVKRLKDRTLVEEVDIPKYWDQEELRPTLIRFAEESVESIAGITEVMLDFAMQLASLVGIPLDHVGTAAVGFRVENFLIRQAHRLGELVPKRIERPYVPYPGAIVLKPRPGIHEHVAVLDFKSMYPSIMIKENVSPDTYLKPEEPEPSCGVNTAPEVGHRFRKGPPGFYKQALTSLLEARETIRKRLKEVDPSSAEYRILDARQKAIKVITNACYGYAGWIGARWYLKPVAEATTAWGRQTILDAIELAKELGLDLIYGDTDSLFVKYEADRIEAFSRLIEERMGLEIKPDRIYERIFFTEAKKRYAGLLPDGRLDIVGLEVVRGDWTGIAKKVQERVLEAMLRDRSVKRAIEIVKESIRDIKAGRVPLSDLIIWKALTKPIDEYKVRAPHAEAARLLKSAGYKLTAGDKVGYVIVKGPGKLLERAKPYIMVSYDDLDLEYYISQQILPVALRILSPFGVTEKDLLD